MTAETRELADVLADLVLNLVVSAELADEDEIHPDTAVRLLEGTVAELQGLGASDRLWLHEHVAAAAREERHPDRRRVLLWLAGELLGDRG